MRTIRIIIKSFRDSFRSVFRNMSLSLASIACITITLLLVAFSWIVSVNVNHFTSTLEEELTITVYLNEDCEESCRLSLEEDIKGLDSYDSFAYLSKDEVKAEMQATSEELNTALSFLSENPLLDTLVVKVKDIHSLSSTSLAIGDLKGVKYARYGETAVDNIVSIFSVTEKVTIVLIAGLVVVTAFLITNTIKLTIFSRRSEIEIMRLVGTSNTVIELPFVIEGFILGVLGALIPILASIYGYILFFDHTGGYLFSHIIELVHPSLMLFSLSFAVAIIGAIVGMFGSYVAVRKYLKI